MSQQSTQQEEQQSPNMSALLGSLWNIAVGNIFFYLWWWWVGENTWQQHQGRVCVITFGHLSNLSLSGERCVTTYDKKANMLSIQNNGIHHLWGRHTCLALRTMPHCLFIRCQKSLCLFGDSDSNLILFHFWKGDLRLWGTKGGGESVTHIFSSLGGAQWVLFLPDSCLLRSEKPNNKDCHSPGDFH